MIDNKKNEKKKKPIEKTSIKPEAIAPAVHECTLAA
jgi:hypothetical protein